MKKAHEFIIFPLDVPDEEQAISLVEILSGKVGVFKIGLELFSRCGPGLIHKILSTGNHKIFLDLKLHDIPETVYRAVRVISELGVSFATVHCAESDQMLRAAAEGAGKGLTLLGVTLLTSLDSGDLKNAGYREAFYSDPVLLVEQRARRAQKTGLGGVVCSALEVRAVKKACTGGMLCVTPGIRPEAYMVKKDDQKRMSTPEQAILNGSDYLVIGRPIRDAADPAAAADMIAGQIESVL